MTTKNRIMWKVVHCTDLNTTQEVTLTNLIPRSFHFPVFDQLEYAKTEKENAIYHMSDAMSLR